MPIRPWQSGGWIPFTIFEVSEGPSGCLVRGYRADDGEKVIFSLDAVIRPLENVPAFIMPFGSGQKFRFSFLGEGESDFVTGEAVCEFDLLLRAPVEQEQSGEHTDISCGGPDHLDNVNLQAPMTACVDAIAHFDIAFGMSFGIRDSAESEGLDRLFPHQIPWTIVRESFEMAYRGGVLNAAHNIALLYLHGYGVELDVTQAKHWFRLAAPEDISMHTEPMYPFNKYGLFPHAKSNAVTR